MNERLKEIFDILKEECGELVVAASKCTRWGLESTWDKKSNLENLAQEAADVMCMIHLLVDAGVLTEEQLANGQASKLDKLKKWSNIFEDAQ